MPQPTPAKPTKPNGSVLNGCEASADCRSVPCPNCARTIEYSRGDAGRIVECPYCHLPLKISRHAFAKRRLSGHDAPEVPQEDIKIRMLLRKEGVALARVQVRQTAGQAYQAAGCVLFGLMACVAAIAFFRGLSGHWFWLLAGAAFVGAAAVGCVVMIRGLPWYIMSLESTRRIVAKHRKRLEEGKRAEEEECRRRLEEEESLRKAQEEHERAQRERELRLTDGSCAECWRGLGWWDFEIAVLMAFEHFRGCHAHATAPTRDAGLDGILDIDGDPVGVQCKHLGPEDFVQSGEIRDFIGALHMHGMKRGYFVTTGLYGSAAKDLAKVSRVTAIAITLLDTSKLMEMGTGLLLTSQTIADSKRRWDVPMDPPPDMPQGPQRRRTYRRRRFR